MKILNEWDGRFYSNNEEFNGIFIQYEDGSVFIKKDGEEREIEWYKNTNGTNWKCSPKSFKSLLKQALKEEELVFKENHKCEYCNDTGEVDENLHRWGMEKTGSKCGHKPKQSTSLKEEIIEILNVFEGYLDHAEYSQIQEEKQNLSNQIFSLVKSHLLKEVTSTEVEPIDEYFVNGYNKAVLDIKKIIENM